MTHALWKKTSIALGAVALAAIALEGFCRWRFPARPTAYELHDKPEGTFRVLAVGGSTVRGLHVPELGFVAQLEAMLREAAPELALEVHNYGRGAAPSKAVARVVEETIDRDEPDLYVVLSGHNEFLFRTGTGGLGAKVRSVLERAAIVRVGLEAVAELRGPAARDDSERILPKKVVPYDRETDWFRERRAGHRANLQRVVGLCSSRGVPLVLCTAPANLLDWPPVHEGIEWARHSGYERDVERIEELLRGDEPDRALAEARALEEDHGEDAMASFLAGRALARLGRGEEARGRLERAVTLDPYPWRALPEFNDNVRELADTPGVHLADVAGAFARAAGSGLVGFDLVSDNCHPTPLGSAIAAREIADVLTGAGLAPADAELPEPEAWIARFEEGLAAEGRLAELRYRYLLDNGVYCMKHPFRNYEAADRYLADACELEPDDWRAWANHGTLELLRGDRESGLEHLREAGRVRGEPLRPGSPEDRRAVPYLREATARAGLSSAELAAAR